MGDAEQIERVDNLDRLIADLVRANGKVHWCRSRWEPDEDACREQDAALEALRAALTPPAPPPPPTPPPARLPRSEAIEVRCEDGALAEVVGSGAFHLEQMSSNHWWMVFEAQGQRVDVWLHARAKITAAFESEDAKVD